MSPNASACLADFIEEKIGCNPNIFGSKYSKGPPCTTYQQLLDLDNITAKLSRSYDHDIYAMTGCLPSCERNVYTIHAEPVTCYDYVNPNYAVINMRISELSYEERVQYIIYEMDSFIADVGGYMGLLLGYSILSLYTEIEALLKKFSPRLLIGPKLKNPAKKDSLDH